MLRRRVSFHTLGCKLNFSETSTLAREFERGGFVRVVYVGVAVFGGGEEILKIVA